MIASRPIAQVRIALAFVGATAEREWHRGFVPSPLPGAWRLVRP